MDSLKEIAELAQTKYGRGELKRLLAVLEGRFMSVTIEEKDIDPALVPVEQIIEMEIALADLLGFEHRSNNYGNND